MLWKGDYLMLEVKKLKKKFGSNVVLNDISFNVSKGDIISIVGPSGSGKSTLLRCLNLIEKPSSGDIIFEGTSLVGKKADLSLLRQKMGMVFQQFNLFPHLTVIDNITLAPVKLKLMNEVTARKKALELLNTINLKDKAEHYPNELSGGQKQRVAIIRTLIMEPDIILFDEPTSALDPEMIGEVLDLIKKVADTGKTMVIVSHEMNFVKKVSNRVLFIDGGKVIFDGKTKDFFSSENIRIKEFLDKIKK
jgi:glutamine ABC transporter, ATP-binding protein GlnQ